MEFLLGIFLLLFGGVILKFLWKIGLGILKVFTDSRGDEKYSSPPPETPRSEYKSTLQLKEKQRPQQPSPLRSEPTDYFTKPPPAIPDFVPQPFDYKADWWTEYSRWYRDQQVWTCEECQISLNDDRQYLHTHHIWGTQHNKPQDLKALCIACHSEQPGVNHRALKHGSKYQEFMEKYGEQWRLLRESPRFISYE